MPCPIDAASDLLPPRKESRTHTHVYAPVGGVAGGRGAVVHRLHQGVRAIATTRERISALAFHERSLTKTLRRATLTSAKARCTSRAQIAHA
eukprot:6186113-Pleurochrysis_carterae.AAC.1